MKKRNRLTGIVLLLVLASILLAACQQQPESPPDTFKSTYVFNDGRSFSINGRSNSRPGEKLEYMLNIDNNDERWQAEYYILLLGSDSVIQEIRHGTFDLSGNEGLQEPIFVEFPKDFSGALGLCVLIPQHGRLIATVTVGDKNAVATGWPDIGNYPLSKTE